MLISPTMKQIESFNVTGFSVRTQNKDEFNEKTAKLPQLWQQFFSSELANQTNIYGVYSNYDSDANGFYTTTVGVESFDTKTKLCTVTIEKGNYLVFQAKGSMPDIVVETWKQIWEFFDSNTEYLRNYISDFEAYNGSDQIAIYIGLK